VKMVLKSLLVGLAMVAAPATLAQPVTPAVTENAAPAPVATPAAPKAEAAAPAVAAPTPLAPSATVGQPVFKGIGIQPQVTKIGQDALWMHDALLMPIITVISLFVLGLLFWASARYRRKANPVASKTSHNTFIEVVWTLVPVLILLVISVPSIKLLAAQYKPVGKDAVTIKAIGNQWYWSYEYSDNGGFEVTANMLPDAEAKKRGEPRLLATDNRMVVPVNTPIRLLVTSNDVIHAWMVPAFWTQMDAVPGRINETSFKVEKTGVYYGQCNQICGARHGYMPITVEVVSKEAYEQWVLSKGGTVGGPKAPVTPAANKS
jgi:cytochrome c oxidase subunit II